VTEPIGIITGCTRPQFLPALYESLQVQDVEWRWTVQLDGIADLPATVPWDDDDRVDVACNERRLGSGITRNIALMRSRAPYVLCVDDDDQLCPGALSQLADALDKHDDCFGAWGETYSFRGGDPSHDELFRSWPNPGRIEPGVIGDIFENEGDFAVHVGSTLWRRSYLVAMGGYGALPRSIDTNPFIACQSLFPHVYVAHPVYRYRLHPEQMTRDADYIAARAHVHAFTFERARELRRILRST
jgi:glycosyltransferase involved in cell wall biosynthesis